MATEAQNYANCRNTPNPTASPNKPPILPRLSTIYDLIMQNEPNFPESQMNITKVLTKKYGNFSDWTLGENEPNTKPNKANFRGKKMLLLDKNRYKKPNQTNIFPLCRLKRSCQFMARLLPYRLAVKVKVAYEG